MNPRVKKLGSAGTGVLVIAARSVQTARRACVVALPAPPRCSRPARPPRRGARARAHRPAPPARDPQARRQAAPVHDERPRLAGCGQPSAFARAPVVLPGQRADALPLAPDTAPRRPDRRSQGRPSAASSRDTQPDRAARAREPDVGLHAHPRRAERARDQPLSDDRRERAAPRRSRVGATADRPRLVAVPPRPGRERDRRRCRLRARRHSWRRRCRGEPFA